MDFINTILIIINLIKGNTINGRHRGKGLTVSKVGS